MAASLAAIEYFMPILAFLVVFIVIYAILMKTKVLGDNNFVALFISFVLSVFFVVEASLVDYVLFSSAWFVVIVFFVFLLFIILAFFPGKLDFLEKGWVSWVVVGALIGFFIIASAYTFNWAVNWGEVSDWIYSDWFGLVLLLVIAAVVSWVLTKKSG
tara:strand:- start:1163 stop:1636 length:474 start_codon:yes stop_codon:yes gene_type:complete